MFEGRARFVLAIITALFVLLGLRFYYYQVVKGRELAGEASAQRLVSIDIEKPRGPIIDRNGIPFTDRSIRHTIILKPALISANDIETICRITGLDPEDTRRRLQTVKEPVTASVDDSGLQALTELGLKGMSIINSLERYDGNSIARHVLGYLNKVDQYGQAGIEKFFNDTLKSNGENSVGIVTDAHKSPLEGLGYRLVQNAGNEGQFCVKLTLDYHIQQIAEKYLKDKSVSGAVVVEDVLTGDIVAMASNPDYDQNAVENYLTSSGKELMNRATASYNLGSIFKIIDAALIFEMGLDPSEEFLCSGSIRAGSRDFKCSSYKKGGHGWVNMTSAFAESCNPYFIDRGLKIGYKNLIRRAMDFGFGQPLGLSAQGVSEASGNLPNPNAYHSDGDIANISIGQGDILATPVQVADMVATIANGGIKNQVNIVDSIVDEQGNRLRSIKNIKGKRIIEKDIADSIKQLMEEVLRTGTGNRINLDEFGGAGGKTGSAETGKDGIVHAWFTGYFPQSNPRYSVAVFVENGQLGGVAAAPIFEGIAAEIMKKGY